MSGGPGNVFGIAHIILPQGPLCLQRQMISMLNRPPNRPPQSRLQLARQ